MPRWTASATCSSMPSPVSEGNACRNGARLRAALLAVLMTLAGTASARDCVEATPQWKSMEESAVTLERGDGTGLTITARVADDWNERAAGYQHICPRVIEESYVLFVFEREIASRFHMNNVHGDLDIGFFAADGTLVDVLRMQAPAAGERSRLYGPSRPFRYALEAAPGFFAASALEAGAARLVLPLDH